ncbi:MAG: serine/threonine protein phosphatase [Deltaproteobacteria bacterium]|nr:serine/threonine protein phosphatase [Deltaproteobacteria bacterium]
MRGPRTIVIGDVHGEEGHLEVLLGRLPELDADDTLVLLGDYVDRGPDSKGVVERVRRLARESVAKVVALRGNHEDKWIDCAREPDPSFLLPPGNGCANMLRSFTGRSAATGEIGREEMKLLFDVASWLPADVTDWMAGLPLWYEDEHAIYVHAGLDAEGNLWRHPSESSEAGLLWSREPGFFRGYEGKRLIFGHTPVVGLPLDHLGFVRRLFDDPTDVWVRGDLVCVDTGCGKGGFLSAIELPGMSVYESR